METDTEWKNKNMNELSNDEAVRIFESLATIRSERVGSIVDPDLVLADDRLWDALCERFYCQVAKFKIQDK